ncbi:MAG: apolipoprotein N-acyltransferase [candidate division Zixibacteria bacterium RBG_16_53_22]|nr:MAG: apolipoprotein N-acyltransferase [candidate division Zixibacteria bacterium RBG_16_53_22]
MKQIRPYFVVISAVLTFLSFPPFTLGPLIFISLVPLLYAVEGLAPYRAFKYGFLWGVIFFLGLVYYIGLVTVPGMIATVLIMALIPATALWIYSRLVIRWSLLALAFIPTYLLTWNWLFTKSDLNYPWGDFGYALSYNLPLVQAADIGGVYLISLAIIVVNLLILASISRRFTKDESRAVIPRLVAAMLIISLYSYGVMRITHLRKETATRELAVGLIQGNITKDIKWDRGSLKISFDRYFSLSRRAVDDGAQLLIWPETALPTYLAQEPQNMALVTAFVDSIGVPLLTGVVYYRTDPLGGYIFYNSAILLEPGKDEYQLYSKVHLVPMSEKIPFSGKIRKLKEIELGQANFSSGETLTEFNLDDFDFSTLICFESAFPGYTRQFARLGAKFLVVITNDMWFGRTSLFEQHAMMAVLRAIENRLPVVRAANTGISMAIDKTGQALARSEIFQEEYLVVKIRPESSRSIYNRIGDIIPQTSAVIAMFCLIIAFLNKKEYIDETYVE